VGSALTGADAGNYTFAGATGDYTVTALALTGSIATGTSIYGSALTPGAVSLSTAISSDAVSAGAATVTTTGHTSTSGNFTAGTHVGSESVGSALTGSDAGNYTFAGATGDYTVTALALTGSIATGTSIYGSALTPGAVSLSNAISGDAVSAGTATVNTTGHTSSSGNLTAGTHTGSESVGSALTGADAGNYTFAGATGDYTVTALALTGSIGTGTSVYGSALTPGAATFINAIANDVLVGPAVSVNTTGLTSSSGHLAAGTHTGVETVNALAGADAGNYTFAGATGDYIVTPLALTVAATGVNKVYDGTTAAARVLSGAALLVGDQVTIGDSAASFAGKNVGSGQVVSVGGITITGADAADYALTNTSATTTAAISPATLTYDAAPASRSVGQPLTGFSGSLSGFVTGESQATDTVGTLLWTTPADAGSPAGRYAIDGGGLTATNYVFVEAPGNAAALTLHASTEPPPEPAPPSTLPQAALDTIAQLQETMMASQGARGGVDDCGNGVIDRVGCSDRDSGITDSGRSVGTNGASVRIVNGGLRLPNMPVAGNE
jgi:hypothetical protein